MWITTAWPDQKELLRFTRIIDTSQLFSNLSVMPWKEFLLLPTGKSVHKYACIVRSFLLHHRHDITFYFMVHFIYDVTPSVYHFSDSSSLPPPILKSLSLQQLHPPPPSLFFGPGRPMFRKGLWKKKKERKWLWMYFWLCRIMVNADSCFPSHGQVLTVAYEITLQKIAPTSQ